MTGHGGHDSCTFPRKIFLAICLTSISQMISWTCHWQHRRTAWRKNMNGKVKKNHPTLTADCGNISDANKTKRLRYLMSDAEYEFLNKLHWVGWHQKLHRHSDMYFSIYLFQSGHHIQESGPTQLPQTRRFSVSYPSVLESIVKYNIFFYLFGSID